MSENQGTTTEPTAAQRLATAREGLQQLLTDQGAALAQQAAAQTDFAALDAQLIELYRQADIDGADVAQAIAAVQEQRTAAAQAASMARLAADDLSRRIGAVRSALPFFENAALQEELAAIIEAGAAAALLYRSALQDYLAAAVVFRSCVDRAARLSTNLSYKGVQPAHQLGAHLIEGAELDRAVSLSYSAGADGAAMAAAAGLFERWRI